MAHGGRRAQWVAGGLDDSGTQGFIALMPSASLELAILLFAAGMCVLCLELFVPSGGILFAIAMVCIAGSVIVAFLWDTTTGVVMLSVDVVLAFLLPSIGLRIWQRTPIGRRMFLGGPRSRDSQDQDEWLPPSVAADGFDYQSLLGEVGRTITALRPAGAADFRGRRIDTVSEGVMIEKGRLVRVVAVEGRRVVVREIE